MADRDVRNARIYLLGFAASVIGDGAMTLAAGIWIKSLTGSSSAAALVSICIYAPSTPSPVAGLIADRARTRRLLVWVNLVMAAAMLPLLGVRSSSELWLIYAVMTCYGIAITLTDPAENALFFMMLPEQQRRRVNGVRLAFPDKHPHAGGSDHYAAYLANTDGYEVELVAERSVTS